MYSYWPLYLAHFRRNNRPNGGPNFGVFKQFCDGNLTEEKKIWVVTGQKVFFFFSLVKYGANKSFLTLFFSPSLWRGGNAFLVFLTFFKKLAPIAYFIALEKWLNVRKVLVGYFFANSGKNNQIRKFREELRQKSSKNRQMRGNLPFSQPRLWTVFDVFLTYSWLHFPDFRKSAQKNNGFTFALLRVFGLIWHVFSQRNLGIFQKCTFSTFLDLVFWRVFVKLPPCDFLA